MADELETTAASQQPRMRVLHVIGKMDRAGAEAVVMNLMRAIDQREVAFDFLVHTNEKADFDDEIERRGGHIYRVPAFTGLNRGAYRRAVERFFDSDEHPRYDIVHGHIGSSAPIYLKVAREHGAKTVAHSHNTNSASTMAATAYRLLTRSVVKHADFFMGCSHEAGADRFGEQIADSPRFEVLHNGFDCDAYRFDADARERVRAELGVAPDELLVGHVGRFNEQKNHDFLLDAFCAVKQLRPDAKLALVGRGELEGQVREKAEAHGIADAVLFCGVRDDVPRLLWAFDVFAFPSRYEGQGLAVVEAQAAGLPCVVSDAVPPVSRVTDIVAALPLEDANAWGKAIAAAAAKAGDAAERAARADVVAQAGYDIRVSSARLVARYDALLSCG